MSKVNIEIVKRGQLEGFELIEQFKAMMEFYKKFYMLRYYDLNQSLDEEFIANRALMELFIEKNSQESFEFLLALLRNTFFKKGEIEKCIVSKDAFFFLDYYEVFFLASETISLMRNDDKMLKLLLPKDIKKPNTQDDLNKDLVDIMLKTDTKIDDMNKLLLALCNKNG